MDSEPFYQAITEASGKVRPPISKNLEYYLYTILVSPVIVQQPVALLLYKSIDSHYSEKISLLKTIGEHSTTVVGIFPQSLVRSPVKSDYYMNMGSIGYSRLSSTMWSVYKDRDFSDVYEEIADRFKTCTQILQNAIRSLSAPDHKVKGFSRI